MKRFLLIFTVVSAVSGSGIYPDAATKYFPFLKREYDARSIAMAGVSVGTANGLYGILSNPASLGYSGKMGAMIAYSPVVLDINGLTVAFSAPVKQYGVFAANIKYLSYGTFEPRDESGNPIEGTLHPYAIAGSVAWSKVMLENLALGVIVRGIYEQLSEGIDDEIQRCSADGFAIDIGAQYRSRSARLIYGILIRNLGVVRSSYSDEETDERGLPLSFAAGFSYIFRNFPTVKAAVDIEKALDDYLNYKLGLEFNVYRQILFVRGGYNFSQIDAEELFSLIKTGSSDKEYQKSNWTLFCLGIGIHRSAKDVDISIDTAIRFRVDGATPGFALSLMADF